MSISSEITSIGENLKKDYQSIANLGADLTNVDKNIENIAELLDGVYDRLPKTEFEEGESVTLENTLKAKLDFQDGKVGFGQASQESTQGYNLINVAGARVDNPVNGVSVSKDGDSIILNGSRTDGSTTNSKNVIYATNNLNLESGDYRLTFVPESGSLNGGRLGVLFFNSNGDGIAYIEIFSGTTTTKSITLNSAVATLTVFYNGAFSATNYKFKVMLSQGTTERAYEQYTGGYASPSPNWEQQVKCVAGRNKFNIGTSLDDYFQTNTNGTKPGSWTVNAVTATIEENKLTIDTYNSSGWNWLSKWVELEPNTDYTISGTNTSVLKIVGFNSNELQTQGTQIIQKTADASDSVKTFNSGDYKYYCLSCFPEATGKYFENIQIEEGSQATPYLPYNTIEEVVSGKNELDISALSNQSALGITATIESDKTITLTGTSTGAGSLYGVTNLNLTLGPGNYKWVGKLISGNGTIPHSGADIAIYVRKSNEILAGVVLSDILSSAEDVNTFSLQEETELYFSIFVNTANIVLNANIGLMILKDTITDLNYEPYITPKTYQFSLGDKKLYEECYIVGSPDNWKIVSNWYRLTSAEFINLTIGTTGNNKQFVVVKSNFNVKPKPGKIYCTHLKYNPTTWYADGYCGIVTPGATLWMQMTQAFESVEAFKTFITTNNMEFVYQTEEPVETPITDTTLISQLNAWYNAHSNNGTTIITSNGNLPMIIKVRGLKGE